MIKLYSPFIPLHTLPELQSKAWQWTSVDDTFVRVQEFGNLERSKSIDAHTHMNSDCIPWHGDDG